MIVEEGDIFFRCNGQLASLIIMVPTVHNSWMLKQPYHMWRSFYFSSRRIQR